MFEQDKEKWNTPGHPLEVVDMAIRNYTRVVRLLHEQQRQPPPRGVSIRAYEASVPAMAEFHEATRNLKRAIKLALAASYKKGMEDKR